MLVTLYDVVSRLPFALILYQAPFLLFYFQVTVVIHLHNMLAVIHDHVSPPNKPEPSLTLQDYNGQQLSPAIRVYLPYNLTAQEFLTLFVSSSETKPGFTFPALQNWFSRLLQNFKLQDQEDHTFHKHPYRLHEIDVQAVDWFWRGRPNQEDRLGFMKIQARIETESYLHSGEEKERADWIPGAVFLRGGSVAILVCLLTSTKSQTRH